MRFVVKKLSPTDADALKAATWYDEQYPGLGDDFLEEFETAILLLADNALIYSVRFSDVRCIRLRRFTDYGVYYLVRSSNEVWVIAVHHGRRHPRWLRQRRRALD